MSIASTPKEYPILAQARAHGVDLTALPRHVAIIMDGNGRWAKRKGLARLLGHREGYMTLKKVIRAASDLGVKYLTVYAFSAENWRRPADEVNGIMKLIEKATRDELQTMHENNVRVNVAGRIGEVPAGLRAAIDHGIKTTAENTGITFTLAVNYGGRAEIVDAVKAIVQSDLMIRTAGEMRWSNFLIWQSAYCELHVTDVTWPEFTEIDFLEAVKVFQQRTRKFGTVVEQTQ
jgi:undecaprenyl diphosphate synthase